MPGILPRGSWGQQKPPVGTPLLAGEGIASGIVASWLMNEGGGKFVKDAAGAHDLLWPTGDGGPSWRVGRSGPAVSLLDPAALTGLRAANQLIQDSDPLTIAARLAFNQSAGSERAYVARGQDGSGNGWSAALMLSAGANWQFSVVTTSGGAAQFNAIDSATSSAEQWYDLVGIFRPGVGPELHVNGRLVATTSTATTTLRSSTYGFSVLEGKSAADNGGQAVGYCEYAHVWRRALSPTEVRTLAVAPFCLFAPPVWRRYFVPDTAAPPPPTTRRTLPLLGVA